MALKVGIQLYSVRNMMKQDPLETIRQVAEAGYRNLEVANHNALEDDGVGFGIPAEELFKQLQDCGARVISAHIFPFGEENYRRVVDYNRRIGNDTLVYPMETYADYDDVMRKVERYERMGQIAAENGMRFLYHNHFHELQKFGGKRVLDYIVENTDGAHVNLELDTFWVLRGGEDPVEVMDRYKTRIKLLHQKDLARDTKTPVNMFDLVGNEQYITREVFNEFKCGDDFVEIGYGCMDIQRIIDKAVELGSVSHIILEQDATRLDELDSIRKSMEGFRHFTGIDWTV